MASHFSSSSEDAVVIDHDDISNYNPAQILPESPDEIKKIRAWLKPTDYALNGGEYRKHLSSYIPGTGVWITSSTTYQEWLEGEEHGMLWIKGIPGSGKSVVAAHLIDELSRTTPRRWSSTSSSDASLTPTMSPLPCYEIGWINPGKVKVLITGRPVPSVEGLLRNCKTLRICLAENMVDMDISRYVEHGLKSSSISSDDRDLIREAIPGRANGLFLYAKLAMDGFLEPTAHSAFGNTCHSPLTPSGARRNINVTYHPGVKRDLKTTKDLVRAAAGPLLEILPNETVSVIHHSFTEYLKCITRSEHDGGYPILRLGATHGRLALACLTYLQTGCLDLVKVPAGTNEGDSELHAWGYDDYGGPSHDYCMTEKERQHLRLKYPFLGYAAANWHIHLTRSAEASYSQAKINAVLDRFFGNTQLTKAWLKIQWPEGDVSQGITRLHIAVHYGLTEYVRELVARSHVDVHAGDAYGKTPLWWAATFGHADVIRILVEAGANPDVDDKIWVLKPLHEVANENHVGAVQALLGAGVDPLTKKTREDPDGQCGNAPRSMGHTPLMYTCHNGHLEALDAFIPFLTDIDTVHRALLWSAEEGRSKFIRRIVQYPGVEVNAKTPRGDTALHAAVKNPVLVRLLLDAGADANVVDNSGKVPLHTVTSADSLSLLVEEGRADINKIHPGDGRSPLLCMLDSYHNEAILKLLEYAPDLTIKDKENNGPLHITLKQSSPEIKIIKALLTAGADPNERNRVGDTPLLVMTMGNRASADMVEILQEAGADINGRTTNGLTVLSRAMVDRTYGRSDNTDINALLDKGADLNCNHQGRTALHIVAATQPCDYVSEPGQQSAIDLIISEVKNLNHGDNQGLTPLHLAATVYENHAKKLLVAGANPTVTTFEGLTPLHLATRARQSNILGLLLEAIGTGRPDAFDAVDDKGHTPLYYACRSGRTESVRLLLDAGADASRKEIFEAVAAFEEEEKLNPTVKINTNRLEEIVDILMDAREDAFGLKASRHDRTYISTELIDAVMKASHEYTLTCLLRAQERQLVHVAAISTPVTLYVGEAAKICRQVQLQELTKSERVNLTSSIKTSFSLFSDSVVKCDLPNMHVIRLLVEKFHVDVNQFRYLRHGDYGFMPEKPVFHHRWWHVALALPYFISKGADLNGKGNLGRTPLHCAFGQSEGHEASVVVFHKDAVRALVAAGADVNSVDDNGVSCLAYARYDVEMVQLLLDNGAIPKADSVFAAIRGKNVEALKALLAAGADPNMHRESPALHKRGHLTYDSASYGNRPLYAAAIHYKPSYDTRTEEETEEQGAIQELVETLLAHAADPYAKFTRVNPESKSGDVESDDDEDIEDKDGALVLGKGTSKSEFDSDTLVHSILKVSGLVHPILDLPGFNPNFRDGKGQTVLHAACHHHLGNHGPIDGLYTRSDSEWIPIALSFLDHLLAQGADPLAADNEGRNLLHHMFVIGSSKDSAQPSLDVISRISKEYPSLINQTDIYGNTPLHMALRYAVLRYNTAAAEALLAAGADPHAVDNNGNTELHTFAYCVASIAQARSLFVKLPSRDLDTNARNSRGETPVFNLVKEIPRIMYPVVAKNEEVITPRHALALFENAGADLFATDGQGRGLLHVVAEGGLRIPATWFEQLTERGVDPMMEDRRKRTTLDVAAACGGESILYPFEKDGGGARINDRDEGIESEDW
ncbi:ankyrin [Lentithecium fluviatile CBS 122367]|uniref:Ankyrin n=1 Tax=Lentithecium fluviatile CBS 122367 TaxID=1168545 RepID=A0A6G1IFR4_9PLEO|nr:ankyrin [Lentithecium fluviatile CBS 122367]